MSAKPSTFIKRPEESVRDKKLELLNAQLKKVSTEISSVSSEIDQKLGRSTESSAENATPASSNANDELKEIIKQQNDLKIKRNAVFDQLKQIDAKIKASTKDIETALTSASNKAKEFKSIGEVDKEISNLEFKLDNGGLSLVDEKKLIKQQSELNKIKKSLVAVQPIKSEVSDLKQQQLALKNTLNKDLDNKHLQKQFEAIQEKLNEQRSVKKSNQQVVNQLFNKRTALQAKRDEIYTKIREVRAQFDAEFKAYKLKRELQRKEKDNEYKWEKLNSQKESDLTKLREDIIAAKSTPALSEDIQNIENCLHELKPSYVASSSASPASSLITGEKKIVSRRKNRAPPVFKSNDSELKEFKGAKKIEQETVEVVSSSPVVESKTGISLSIISIAVLGQYGLPVPEPTDKELIEETFNKLQEKKIEVQKESEKITAENIEKAEKRLEQVVDLYVKREQELKDSIDALTIKDEE